MDVASSSKSAPKQPWKHHRIDSHYISKPKYVLTSETKAYLRQTSFDNWSWDDNEIIGLFEHIFDDLGLIKEFNIDITTLRRFLMAIKDCYNNNVS